MSDKPQQTKKTKKRRDSDAGIRLFLTILIALIALVMIVQVVYTLRHNTSDPATREGVYMEKTPTETDAVPTETTETVTEATEPTEPTEPVDPVREAAQRKLESMTLEEKVYQLFFVTNQELTGVYYSGTAGDETRAALASRPVGGIVFDRNNIFDAEQLRTMIENTQTYSAIPLFIGIEEEGGIEAYSYLRTIGVTGRYSEMGVYGEDYARGESINRVYEIGSEIGTALTGIGFNIDLAPVADTLVNANNPELGAAGGRRAFSADPEITAELVKQMVTGLHDSGCMACLKYFPTLSAANSDSRYATAVSNLTLDEIRGLLLPFIRGIENGADVVMVSHLCLPSIVGESRPADLCSQIVNDLLREELGYDGVVMTDSFEKGAISYNNNYGDGVAALAAIQAGCDVIYMPEDLETSAQAIISAVNNEIITEERIDESVLRILMLKYANGLME